MKNYKGKREEKYSFWKDAFCFSIMVWALILVYIFFMHLSEISLLKDQQESQSSQAVQIISVDGDIPGDDTEASGYASLEAMGMKVEDLYENSASFKITHYCGCSKCCGKWSSGSDKNAVGCLGVKLTPYYSIAVDKSIIPLGTVLWDDNGNYYRAEDTGSGVNGYHIDLFTGDHEAAVKAGVNNITLYWND